MANEKWVLLNYYFVDVLYAYLTIPIGYKRRDFNADSVNYGFIKTIESFFGLIVMMTHKVIFYIHLLPMKLTIQITVYRGND